MEFVTPSGPFRVSGNVADFNDLVDPTKPGLFLVANEVFLDKTSIAHWTSHFEAQIAAEVNSCPTTTTSIKLSHHYTTSSGASAVLTAE